MIATILILRSSRDSAQAEKLKKKMLLPLLTSFAVICFLFGCFMFVSWLPRLAVSNAPIVTGIILDRTPISDWGIPSVDYRIEVPETNEIVHASTQKYLMDKIPDEVRFHYSGDPLRPVYLFEHEENPLWIWLYSWAWSAVSAIITYIIWKSWKARQLRDAMNAELWRKKLRELHD